MADKGPTKSDPKAPATAPIAGVSVAEPVMEKVMPVGDELITRLSAIISRAQALQELTRSHQNAVHAILVKRDELVHALLERHGQLSVMVSAETDRISSALEAIMREFHGDTVECEADVSADDEPPLSPKTNGDNEEQG